MEAHFKHLIRILKVMFEDNDNLPVIHRSRTLFSNRIPSDFFKITILHTGWSNDLRINPLINKRKFLSLRWTTSTWLKMSETCIWQDRLPNPKATNGVPSNFISFLAISEHSSSSSYRTILNNILLSTCSYISLSWLHCNSLHSHKSKNIRSRKEKIRKENRQAGINEQKITRNKGTNKGRKNDCEKRKKNETKIISRLIKKPLRLF
jgi:hypothetical protein